ncbi:transposase [Roseomonas pecuniae]|uniref:Transposase n=1 Tax=Muricoccus pecuniae TaxID=693023 RepID=A0A840YCK9_9PROT|nr:transposase [Roseomonas pecuniae]
MAMMGERPIRQEALFYGFSLEEHVPADHLLRSIDRFVELSSIRSNSSLFTAPSGDPRSTPN